jgi:putative PIN family toxin of toxin-antitoxin system
MKHWVVDTNVIVSGLLVDCGHPAQLINAVANGEVKIVYDTRILAEYREVLNRARLQIAPTKIAHFLALLRGQELVVASHCLRVGPDLDDLMFIEVALATRQKTIVTGNLRDFPLSIRHGVRIITPAQAVAEL